MKKQYMDFVPSKAQTKTTTVKRSAKAPVAKVGRTTGVKSQKVVKKTEIDTPKVQLRATKKVAFTGEEKPVLGKVENLNTRFVKSDVPKRPLNKAPHFTTGRTGIATIKAQKVGLKSQASAKPVEKHVEKSKTAKSKATYQTPKSPFVNQGKVAKRPLSKNVYPKKVEAAVSEAVAGMDSKGPVTIISKPEKQAHVGMIVTIILTIILGAAAGTVAFLLLPK